MIPPFTAVDGERLSVLLRRRRIELGMTQIWVSATIELKRGQLGVSAHERGVHRPSRRNLAKYAKLYGIPDVDILRAYNVQTYGRNAWRATVAERMRQARRAGIHGTVAEARQHIKDGEAPCPECLAALQKDYRERLPYNREWMANKRAQRVAAGLTTMGTPRIMLNAKRSGEPLRPCGTSAAYWRHVKNREEPCEACSEAERQRGREKAYRTGLAKGPRSMPKSGYRNVYRETRTQRWRYRFRRNGIDYEGYGFITSEDAWMALQKKRAGVA